MESGIIESFLKYMTQGGTAAVIALLFFFVCLLIWYAINISKQNTANIIRVYAAKDKENSSIKEIVDKYYKGNLDLVQALNEIKIVLITIQNTKR